MGLAFANISRLLSEARDEMAYWEVFFPGRNQAKNTLSSASGGPE